jgi:uncharacterized integral membrane protein
MDIDYILVYFIVLFLFWIFLLELTVTKKEYVALKYIQFIFSIPLIISLAHNSYVQSFVMGYAFCFAIGILSLYIMIADYIN